MTRSPSWSRSRAAGLLTAAALLVVPRSARGQGPTPVPSGQVTSGVLRFDGHATLGDFTGTTSAVRGELQGAASIDSVTGWVEAPVRSLTTGNGKRDRDLNASMESDRFPVVRYELSGVTVRGTRGDTVAVTLRGTFVIHGVPRSTEIDGTAVFRPDAVEVTGEVPLDLDDFAIKGLSKMLGILRMHPAIEVHLDVTFTPMSTAITPRAEP